jgi:hypothetical protein
MTTSSRHPKSAIILTDSVWPKVYAKNFKLSEKTRVIYTVCAHKVPKQGSEWGHVFMHPRDSDSQRSIRNTGKNWFTASTNLLEAVEAGSLGVHIVLVHLVSKDEELLLRRETNHCFNVVTGQDLGGGSMSQLSRVNSG